MIQEIKMPSAGQTTDEATIVKVNIKVGDTVKRGDELVEAETDKAILPVESFAAGEVLDCDGDCGGFNLNWAWRTGLLTANSAARYLGEQA